MAFPLPIDPAYRKLVVTFWLDDIDDRLKINRVEDAEKSWKIANEIYLSLPPGQGDPEIENWLVAQRVKLNQVTSTTTNEDNL
jgi:hypothetical protein